VVRVPLIYGLLTAVEQRLNPAAFFRANRSQIINLHCVESVENEFDGRLVVKLTESRQVEISRRQSRRLRIVESLAGGNQEMNRLRRIANLGRILLLVSRTFPSKTFSARTRLWHAKTRIPAELVTCEHTCDST
jgi:hypothetical protein